MLFLQIYSALDTSKIEELDFNQKSVFLIKNPLSDVGNFENPVEIEKTVEVVPVSHEGNQLNYAIFMPSDLKIKAFVFHIYGGGNRLVSEKSLIFLNGLFPMELVLFSLIYPI